MMVARTVVISGDVHYRIVIVVVHLVKLVRILPVLSIQVHDVTQVVEELGARVGRLAHHSGGHLPLEVVAIVAGIPGRLKDELATLLNRRHFLIGEDLSEIHAKRRRARGVGQVGKEMVVVPRLMIDVATQHAIVGKSERPVAAASHTHLRTLPSCKEKQSKYRLAPHVPNGGVQRPARLVDLVPPLAEPARRSTATCGSGWSRPKPLNSARPVTADCLSAAEPQPQMNDVASGS